MIVLDCLGDTAGALHPGLRAAVLFDALQRSGGLFGGGGEGAGASRMWIYLGLYVLAGLVFGALAAQRALVVGRSGAAWFGIGFLLPLIGYVMLLARPKRAVIAPAGIPRGLQKIPVTRDPVQCPKCGSPNHPAARRCLSCGAPLEPLAASEVPSSGLGER